MTGLSVGWSDQPFNENKPFGKGSVVGGDNIDFSRQRWEAIKAVKARTATPEQTQLVHDADLIYQEALALRGE